MKISYHRDPMNDERVLTVVRELTEDGKVRYGASINEPGFVSDIKAKHKLSSHLSKLLAQALVNESFYSNTILTRTKRIMVGDAFSKKRGRSMAQTRMENQKSLAGTLDCPEDKAYILLTILKDLSEKHPKDAAIRRIVEYALSYEADRLQRRRTMMLRAKYMEPVE